jgi:hypothetical protein
MQFVILVFPRRLNLSCVVVVAVRELTGCADCQEGADKGDVFVHLVSCVTTFAQVNQRSAGLSNYELVARDSLATGTNAIAGTSSSNALSARRSPGGAQFLSKEVANSELENGSSPPGISTGRGPLGEGGKALFLQRRLGGVGKAVGGGIGEGVGGGVGKAVGGGIGEGVGGGVGEVVGGGVDRDNGGRGFGGDAA